MKVLCDMYIFKFAVIPGPNFMALLTAEFCAYDHDSPLMCKPQISALAL